MTNNDKLAKADAFETAIELASDTIDQALAKCSPQATQDLAPLVKGFRIAQGIAHLRKALDENVMKVLMNLQGTALGFLADQTYPESVVKNCAIEGMMMGIMPVNNEMNIIGGRTYAAKNGMLRLVKEWPGVSRFEVIPGVAEFRGDTAYQPMTATWLLNGKPMRLVRDKRVENGREVDERISVRVNKGQGPDAVIGKATRKIAKAVYEHLSGIEISDGEASDAAIDTAGQEVSPPAPPEQDGRRMKIGEPRQRTELRQEQATAGPRHREPGEEG